MDGNLAGLRLEHNALHAQNVAQIVLLEGRVGFLAHIVLLHINLNISLAVQQMGEGGLAHDAAAGHAARDGNRLTLQRVIIVHNFRGMVGHVVAGDLIGVLPGFHQRGQLLTANLLLLGEVQGAGVFHLGHVSLSFL